MKAFKLALVLLAVAVVAVVFWRQQQAQEKLHAEIAALNEQNNSLNAANQNLSNLVAQANSSSAMSKEQSSELLKLRGEVGVLRNQAGQLVKMRAENQQLRNQPSLVSSQPVQISAEDQFTLVRLHTVSTMKQLSLGMRVYSGDHNDTFVTNFDQLTEAYYSTNNYPSNIGTSAFEFVNVGALNYDKPEMIVFREKTPRQLPGGGWERAYALVDGSVKNIYSPDGNFDFYEKQKSPPPNQ